MQQAAKEQANGGLGVRRISQTEEPGNADRPTLPLTQPDSCLPVNKGFVVDPLAFHYAEHTTYIAYRQSLASVILLN
jgi:hypothetical protein